ncbi:hypothetical protein, variant 1 [Aphanomyces astaci]|uniref:Dolichyldiphosphatase n=1 Tax=Aphanomyces astaci TaxID=112090 RepID=W4HA73_APHAT|nr:hypothetical protein, variant 1 [Aphanomyces astaci]ETV88154.1 hypothetical protein, variant 1 [Aphanomyces astaci]|eukprot:XP_009823017.1 hypothetical protein, variant 1 [Aphanomyces astaci]
MGSFQTCDTCTGAPTTTTAADDEVHHNDIPPLPVEDTESGDVQVPAMADDSSTDLAPTVLPATTIDDDTLLTPHPARSPPAVDISTSATVDVNQTLALDPTTAVPTTTLIAAVASAVATEVASQAKKAVEAASSDAALLTGVSDSSSQLKKPFSLTWVMYDVDDPLGQLLALVTLSPVFIMVMYATLLVFQRDLHIAFLLLGQLLNEVFNQILKRTIDQKRPDGADMEDAVLYTSNRMSKRREWEHKVAIVGVVALALLVFVSRIRLGYHSVAQVVVGATVGTGTGILWYIFMENLAVPLFPWIASWEVCQRLYIRDCSHIPDLVEFHYKMTILRVTSTEPLSSSTSSRNTKYRGM